MTEPTAEPDNPAAYALARHIADHPVSTIQAAFRYLNAPLGIELHEDPAAPATDQAALRDRIADALRTTPSAIGAENPQLGFPSHHQPGESGYLGWCALCVRDIDALAAAVLAVLPAPADRAAAEAYRLALSTALRLGAGANWEAIRDRAEDLVAEVEQLTSARRRLLDQRRPDTDQTAESAPAEEHRFALSEALGLGAGAPWDAIHDRVTELGLPPLHRDPVARRLGLVAEHRATVLEKAADWFESDGRYVQQMFGHQAAAELRRMAAEPAPADTGHDDSETEGQAPPVCQGFVWIGQSFATCDRCGQPAWEHAGEEVPVEGAGPFDNRRTVRPWKPGQADAIRAKWAPEQPAAAQQPKEA